MSGLLLKEWYMLCKYCRIFLLVILVFIGVSVIYGESEQEIFFLMYPPVMAGVLPITLAAYDERSGWDACAHTFPYSRAKLVSSKYLIGLFAILFAWLLCAAVLVFSAAGSTWSAADKIGFLAAIFAAALVSPSVMLPIVFRFGAEKSRVMLYILIAVVCALGAGTDITRLPSVTPGAVPAFAALLFAGSWTLSILLYKKREF